MVVSCHDMGLRRRIKKTSREFYEGFYERRAGPLPARIILVMEGLSKMDGQRGSSNPQSVEETALVYFCCLILSANQKKPDARSYLWF